MALILIRTTPIMRRILIYALAGLLIINQAGAQMKTNNTSNFDNDWRFHLGALLGGEQMNLDDSI